MDGQQAAITDRLTTILSFLAFAFPNEDINRVMVMAWNILHARVARVVVGNVTTPVAMVHPECGMLMLIPPDWDETSLQDPTMAMGAVVFCGSYAVDFYNDQLEGHPEEARERARAYEAELLHTLQQCAPAWVPNSYQAEVLATFPEGLRTPGLKFYPHRVTPSSLTETADA